jgi:hypothetical protein
MCRSIKTLRRADEPATEEEIRAAALQFVRKVSGYREPSRRNAEAFETAVDEVSVASWRLLEAVADVAPVGSPSEGRPTSSTSTSAAATDRPS